MNYCAVLLLACWTQEPMLENPEYKGWARCKPGSWVRLRTESGDLTIETTSTLKSVRDGEVVLEEQMATTFQGKTTKDEKPTERKVGPAMPAEVRIVVLQEGDEELTVAGKKIPCRWKQVENRAEEKKYTMKMWISDAVPGGVARAEMSIGGKSRTRVVTAWERKE